MFWLDGILLVGIGFGAVLGARSGFLQQFGRMVGLGVAFYTAFIFNDRSTAFLLDYVLINTEEYVARCLSFLIVFFSVYLIIHLGTRLMQKFIKAIQLDSLDRLLGAVVGAGKMMVVLAVLCLGLSYFPHPNSQQVIAKSVLAPALITGLELVVEAIPTYYHDRVQDGVASIQQTIQKNKGPAEKTK